VVVPLLVACQDNEGVEGSAEVTADTVELRWDGGDADAVAVYESRGPSADAECDTGKNVWWARTSVEGARNRVRSPLLVGQASDGFRVSAAPAWQKGTRYVVHVFRAATNLSPVAYGCFTFTYGP